MIQVTDLSRKILNKKEAINRAIDRVLNSGQFILSTEVKNFESLFANYVGVKYCVGVANGTDAIEIALRSLGVRQGDYVATAANAGNYSSTAIRSINANVVYMEVDECSRNLTMNSILKSIDERISVLIVTHLYGQAANDISEIADYCKSRNIRLIEDCSQAHGAIVGTRHVGTFGDVGTFSFYPTKNLGAIGDAGAIITNSQDIYTRTLKLRSYGWSSKYQVEENGGRNSRLDEIQAAILSELLPSLDEDNSQRRRIAKLFSEMISSPKCSLPMINGSDYVAHLYVIRVPNRPDFIEKLKGAGVGTAIHYPIPDHKQNIEVLNLETWTLPITEQLATEVLTIPCYPELNELEVLRVIEAINSIT